MNEDLIGHIGLYLLSLILLWFAFRPRKPKEVYGRFNQMLRDGYVSGFGVLSFALLYGIFGDLLTKLPLGEHIFALAPFAAPIWLILYLSYRWYWSQPFSRKKTGIAAVDEAVQRYEKPKEYLRGIVHDWTPDIVVDGKAYKLFTNNADEPSLAFDLNGQVVRDETLMRKIAATLLFGLWFVHPEYNSFRFQAYGKIKKAMHNIQRRWLARWEQLFPSKSVPDGYRQHFETLKKTLEFVHEYGIQHLRLFEAEGEIGLRHGYTRAERIEYEEAERINQEWRRFYQWAVDNIDVLRQGIKVAKLLRSEVLAQRLVLPGRSKKELLWLIGAILIMETGERLPLLEKFAQAGEIGDWYGMTEEHLANWRARLAWVDLVDSWVAQGYTGEALEAKKQEYLEAQERAERERRREERRRKREERARKRAEREAKQSLQQQETKEQ